MTDRPKYPYPRYPPSVAPQHQLGTRFAPSKRRGTLLTGAEFDRLTYLLGLVNDLNVTQLDTDEITELRSLHFKLMHDGEEMPS